MQWHLDNCGFYYNIDTTTNSGGSIVCVCVCASEIQLDLYRQAKSIFPKNPDKPPEISRRIRSENIGDFP